MLPNTPLCTLLKEKMKKIEPPMTQSSSIRRLWNDWHFSFNAGTYNVFCTPWFLCHYDFYVFLLVTIRQFTLSAVWKTCHLLISSERYAFATAFKDAMHITEKRTRFNSYAGDYLNVSKCLFMIRPSGTRKYMKKKLTKREHLGSRGSHATTHETWQHLSSDVAHPDGH